MILKKRGRKAQAMIFVVLAVLIIVAGLVFFMYQKEGDQQTPQTQAQALAGIAAV